MKGIFVILMLSFSFFSWSQNIEFRLGGSLTYNSPYLNDVVNPFSEGLTRSELLSPEYSWFFSNSSIVNGIFSQYYGVDPKIGATVNGILKIKLNHSFHIRTGVDLEYVSFTRVAEERLASYNDGQNYILTLELIDVQYENSLKTFYVTVPLNIEYQLKDKDLSVFGGVKFSARAYDNVNVDSPDRFISFDRRGVIYTLPLRNDYMILAHLGVSYKLNNKINAELNLTRGITNMYYISTTFSELYFNESAKEEFLQFNKQKSLIQQFSIGISYQLIE